MSRPDLGAFAANIYSQNGEDGILGEVFTRLADGVSLDHWCVEFGAWDGVHLSNTCRLIREDGYSAVLIEGHPSRASELEKNFPEARVHKICRFIQLEGPNSLESTLMAFPIPQEFDFLSIDVDGCDYWIWKSLVSFNPKVVCIEFNQTVPNSVSFVQEKDFSVKQGAGAKALVQLGEEKGYSLVAVTHCNLIFVRSDFRHLVTDQEESLEKLNPAGNGGTFVFSGYDGHLIFSADTLDFPWHGASVKASTIQALPRILRVFPGNLGKVRRVIWRFWNRKTRARKG